MRPPVGHPGSRRELWGYDSEVGEGVVDVYVSYLRRKLETFGPNTIDTVRWAGYRLHDDAP